MLNRHLSTIRESISILVTTNSACQLSLVLNAATIGGPSFLARHGAGKRFLFVSQWQSQPGVAKHNQLKHGDIILKIDGNECEAMHDLDAAYGKESIQVDVWRDPDECQICVYTAEESPTSHIVMFSRAILQPPQLAVRQTHSHLPNDVFISHISPGTPAQKKLTLKSFITHVNYKPISNLADFINLARDAEGSEGQCLKAIIDQTEA